MRPWYSRWGATNEEVRRSLPGDEFVPRPRAQSTWAVSVKAPAEGVWPWLVQMGYGRAGWYSYDWIDNDGKPSLDQIDATLQDLKVGDRIDMLPGFRFPFEVSVAIDPNIGGPSAGLMFSLAVYDTITDSNG